MALMSTGPATAAAVESTPTRKIELLESTPTAEKAIKGFQGFASTGLQIQGLQAQKHRRQHDVTELT
jgi:hypothetical protein